MATYDLWIIGDSLAGKAHAQLQQIGNDLVATNRRPLYIQDKFAIHSYTNSELYTERNPLIRYRRALLEGVKENDRLPKHIIVLFNDSIVRFADVAEDIFRWIFSETWRVILTRLDQLPQKAKPKFTPKILFIKPSSKSKWADVTGQFLADKRLINRAMDKQIRPYLHMAAQNIDSILPTKNSLFDHKG